jgi:hypothetical protein
MVESPLFYLKRLFMGSLYRQHELQLPANSGHIMYTFYHLDLVKPLFWLQDDRI